MESAYRDIVHQCISYALRHGWKIHRESAHLGYYKWKHEPWWKEMKLFIIHMDLSMYPIHTWDWVDQCDIGIDYFNQYVEKHRAPHPIFKKYIMERLSNERIRAA
jgi:hypothetical protein